MNEFLSKLGINLTRIALVFGIVFLAYHNIDGWGWLIFAFILTL